MKFPVNKGHMLNHLPNQTDNWNTWWGENSLRVPTMKSKSRGTTQFTKNSDKKYYNKGTFLKWKIFENMLGYLLKNPKRFILTIASNNHLSGKHHLCTYKNLLHEAGCIHQTLIDRSSCFSIISKVTIKSFPPSSVVLSTTYVHLLSPLELDSHVPKTQRTQAG